MTQELEMSEEEQGQERGTMVSTGSIELQLVSTIAELRADMRHVRETGDRTHDAVVGLTGRVSNLEADVATLKARPSVEPLDPELQKTVAVLKERSANQQTLIDTLRVAIDGRSLSWPKLITGVAAIVGIAIGLGLYVTPPGV
jgi:uncharacterized coiled-coil protein SlyX